jgi:hypothetical protein
MVPARMCPDHRREMVMLTTDAVETAESTQTTETTESPATKVAARWKARQSTKSSPPAGGGAVYGLGMIGALVYFLRTAETREDYILAVGKAVVWPAILVYLAFRRLG